MLRHELRRRKLQYFACAVVLVSLYQLLGIGDYVYARSFQDFSYPLNIDIQSEVRSVLGGRKPTVTPINYYPYRYLSSSAKCGSIEKLDLFIAVKSAMHHFEQRTAIRQTYGQEDFYAGRIVKIIFFLGIGESPELQRSIDAEIAQYKDVIQADFQDTYFNNTIKTMMSFRWAYEHCSTADYYLFTDDDMFISVHNLLDYVHDTKYKPNEILLAGYVFNSSPKRFRGSKWRVSLQEYPWDKWPPYVTAGAYVTTNKAMKTIFVASLFVKHFRFDDIYLGIVAKKVGIEPVHCDQFHFYKKPYSREGYRDVIASHGYHDCDELVRVWTEVNSLQDRSNTF